MQQRIQKRTDGDTVNGSQPQQQSLSLSTVMNEAPKVLSIPQQATLWYPISPSFLETIPPGYYCLHSKELAGKGAAEFKPSHFSTNLGDPTQTSSVKADPEPIYMDFLKSSIEQKFKEYNDIVYKDSERSLEVLRNLNAGHGKSLRTLMRRLRSFRPRRGRKSGIFHVDAPVVVKQQKEVAIPILRQINNPLVSRSRQPIMLSSVSSNVEAPQALHCHSTQNQLRYRAAGTSVQQRLGAPHEVHAKAYQERGLPQQAQAQTPVQQRSQVQTQVQLQQLHPPQHGRDQQQLLDNQQFQVQQQLQVQQCQTQAQQPHVRHQVQQRFQAPQLVQAQQGYRIVARELQTQTRFGNNYSTNNMRAGSTTQVFIYTVAPRPAVPVPGGNRQAGPELLSSHSNVK
ncbi:unnamed protein product [Orchesella dallaii]|uniref:Uncharacterized protein n=1 Tax=Orchesella dallaii TaxID=48710 RepID=A0ABP1RZU6_9HEXA